MPMSQESCTDIIAFAAAEMKDVASGFGTRPCPVLSSLARADPKKSDPRHWLYEYQFCFGFTGDAWGFVWNIDR